MSTRATLPAAARDAAARAAWLAGARAASWSPGASLVAVALGSCG